MRYEQNRLTNGWGELHTGYNINLSMTVGMCL